MAEWRQFPEDKPATPGRYLVMVALFTSPVYRLWIGDHWWGGTNDGGTPEQIDSYVEAFLEGVPECPVRFRHVTHKLIAEAAAEFND